ncbi:tyrosine-type recombinase/integrase [Candidatus Kurthia intestinigallinarum]|uniref:tyrosine-type recombinase/integrase n=1 Tax=Candidatus Kurthia intestinigallinarum TaxID=1562256 RepID=UPI000F8EF071
MKKVQKEYSLKEISTHGLRHTHCTLLLEAGVPPREVMERLGHLDIEITMKIYAHVTEQAQTKTADCFVDYLITNTEF